MRERERENFHCENVSGVVDRKEGRFPFFPHSRFSKLILHEKLIKDGPVMH